MIVDGKKIAEDIYTELGPKFSSLGRQVRLGIVVVGANPVIESFVIVKSGDVVIGKIDEAFMERLKKNDIFVLGGKTYQFRYASGQTVQLGESNLIALLVLTAVVSIVLGMGMPTTAVYLMVATLAAPPLIQLGVTPMAAHMFVMYFGVLSMITPPVALAAVEILQRSNVQIAGARTVVVGAGRLVGAPSAWLLRSLGAQVSVFSLEEGSIEDLKTADIVVSGAGNPGFIKPEHLKQGVAFIDGGTSELNKKIAGDADPACAGVAGVFTPVPGGVGPVAVAMIFRNLLTLVKTSA